MGYREGTSQPMDLSAGGQLDVDLRLSTDAVRLDPLTVTGIPRSPVLEEGGFYERRTHFGPDGLNEAVFLEQHDIERMNPAHMQDVFDHVRGVRTDRGGVTMRGGCIPAIVINGFLARAGRSNTSYQSINRLPPLSRREITTPRVLAGVEVYYGTAVPARYMTDAGLTRGAVTARFRAGEKSSVRGPGQRFCPGLFVFWIRRRRTRGRNIPQNTFGHEYGYPAP